MQEMQHDGTGKAIGIKQIVRDTFSREELEQENQELAEDNEVLAKALDKIQTDLPLEEIQQFFDASKFMTAICAQLSRKNMQLENNKEIIDRLQDDLVKAYTIINGARELACSVDTNDVQASIATDVLEQIVDMLPEKEPVSS